jgi:PBP1b-binding outer membrane lipoprotein LpoB
MMDGFFESMADATLDSMPEPLKINFLNLNPDFSALENMFEKTAEECRLLKTGTKIF